MTAWLPRDPAATAPLAGVRVLDLSELLPGPFLTQSLVELGADVLKVERPPGGDPVRLGAPGLFAAVNRGKRGLLANLKDPAQRQQVLALADAADVLVESFRPGVLARLGLGVDVLHARNPRLVVVSLSGYGQHGPRAQWPGHDINYLAAAGVVHLAQKDGAGSPSLGIPVADLAGATYALAALNAALFQRERSGRGQHLDVALADCAAHGMNPRLALLADCGGDAALVRQRVQQRAAYGVFACRCGGWLSVAALEDHFWQALVQALPLPQWAGPALARGHQRATQAAAINADIAAALRLEDRAPLLQRLAAADVPVAEVVALDELPQQPQLQQRGLWQPGAGGPLLGFPVRLAGMVTPPAEVPPLGPAPGSTLMPG